MTPEEKFDDLVAQFVGMPGIVPPHRTSGFGRNSLRFNGKIFAMLVRRELVVKLPAARVTELAAAGDGIPFDANKGIAMREWFALDAASSRSWFELAREALAFGGG